jgi:hypothetical protein
MGRQSGLLLLLVVVAAGVTIGVLARAWLDREQGQRQDAGAPLSVPTSLPSTVAAAPTTAPPLAPATPVRPAPTPILAAPTPTPASRDVVVEVSEGQLQSQLSDLLVGKSLSVTPLGDATIQSVTVALRDRQVRVGGGATVGFVSAPFTAAGTVDPSPSGRPVVSVSEATLGGVLLPDPVRLALTESLQTQVDGLFAERSLKVRTIDITDGRMRVVGTVGS